MGKLYASVFFIIICFPFCSRAQEMDCEQTIAYATDEFNAGHFHSLPDILKDCMPKFSRDQRQRAHLLMTQTYLLLDDPIGAEQSFLEVLSANPEFVADEKLHAIDVVYLSKRFTATPKFSWFVGAGSNVSPVRVILDNPVAKYVTKKYSFLPGYSFGVGGEYSYDDNIRIRAEVNFMQTAYRSEILDFFERDTKEIRNRQTWMTVPVYVSYSDNVGPYRPYAYAGFSVSRLFGDRAAIALQKVEGEGEEKETVPIESPDFDFRVRRNEFNRALIFGAGVKYKMGLDFVFAEVRYSAGLKNIVREDTQYGDYSYDQVSPEWVSSFIPASGYAHRDDYLRLDNIALTVGFLRPLYKPRELKRARTKSVLRKMKRSN